MTSRDWPSSDGRPSPAGIEQEALEWLIKLTSGNATEDDAEALRKWRRQSEAHDRAFQAAARLWQASGTADTGPVTVAYMPPTARISRRALFGSAAAAAVAGIAVVRPFELWPSLTELTSDVRTAVGQQRTITLPDGSTAELNTRTSLNLNFDGQTRGVTVVSGEAAFSVVPDPRRPFVVAAADGRITAHGTEFSIRHVGNEVAVTCVSGSVGVECNDSAMLRPGQQISYAAGKLGQTASVDPALATAWRRGVLVFRDEPLGDIVSEINRYRAGRVVLLRPALTRQRMSGVFHLDRLEEALTHIESVLAARTQHVANGIVLIY